MFDLLLAQTEFFFELPLSIFTGSRRFAAFAPIIFESHSGKRRRTEQRQQQYDDDDPGEASHGSLVFGFWSLVFATDYQAKNRRPKTEDRRPKTKDPSPRPQSLMTKNES